MRPLKTLTIVEILPLFKKYFGTSITRATLYTYMKSKNFPPHTGIGTPRRWREDRVLAWIKEQINRTEEKPKKQKQK